jgi:beta-lactamase regulating signal transducer with metallopeptidase domain
MCSMLWVILVFFVRFRLIITRFVFSIFSDKHLASNFSDKRLVSIFSDKHLVSNISDKHLASNLSDKHLVSNFSDKHLVSNFSNKPRIFIIKHICIPIPRKIQHSVCDKRNNYSLPIVSFAFMTL